MYICWYIIPEFWFEPADSRYFVLILNHKNTQPWPASGTRRLPFPLRGSTSSAHRGSVSCRCRWDTGGGFLEVPAPLGRRGSPEDPTAAAHSSIGPTCSGTACFPAGHQCSGFLRDTAVTCDQDLHVGSQKYSCLIRLKHKENLGRETETYLHKFCIPKFFLPFAQFSQLYAW